ncbi:hypothetical protein [Comamonas fluminis]|uniref:hypothetical protein n=1 Tax=Comamonas fluminis TaxID=2796366 RepID=UPI001C471EB3|nr:hypothetical protein [Comamonas fluminis]
MSKEPSMACPVCRTELSIAQLFISEEAQRTFNRLAVLSIPLGVRVLRYLTLFTPPKTRLTQDKQLKLIEQLLPDLERGAITVGGLDFQAPKGLWDMAFDRVFAVADDGKLSLPLTGHGYLYSTIRDQSNKAAAKAEVQTEQDRRNTPQRGPLQINGGLTSIGAALGNQDPALADMEQRSSQAVKPSNEIRKRIAEITGKGGPRAE